MSKALKVELTCRQCGKEFTVEVQPIIPAKLYGPSENCHPAEGGEYEPEECPHCEAPVNEDDMYAKYESAADDARHDYPEDPER